jgi:hypothetical protein
MRWFADNTDRVWGHGFARGLVVGAAAVAVVVWLL